MLNAKEIERFNKRFVRLGDDECWPWTYHANHYGHGRMWAAGRNMLVSHIALVLSGRPRPTIASCALHSCDNPPCCNPKHLRWGTQIENIADRVARGRNGALIGSAHPQAKLAESDVNEIRTDGRSARIVAAEYCVSIRTIYNIRAGKSWRHHELASN